jgi:solute carrier family 13 (sodium-dependent dicarboxylate transporter), member 2/3/5
VTNETSAVASLETEGHLPPPITASREPARVEPQRKLRKARVGFALAWLGFFGIAFLLPAPAGLSAPGKATLAVVAWVALVWVAEAIPIGVSGILIPMLLVLSHAVTPFPKAASGFSAPVVFLCLAAFLFPAIMQAAGLDRRIALVLLDKLKVRTANGVIWAMSVVAPPRVARIRNRRAHSWRALCRSGERDFRPARRVSVHKADVAADCQRGCGARHHA